MRKGNRCFGGCGSLLLALLALQGCGMGSDRISEAEAAALTGGDPQRGASLIREKGCGSCHTIPGIAGARATVAVPLTGFASRLFVAGVLPNTPENLVTWLLDPPAVDPKTAMPNTGLDRQQARDIAAYLYRLR